MTRTRVRLGRVLTLSVVLAGGMLAAGRAAGGQGAASPARPPLARHVVAQGDTLWEIARARVGPAGDPRPLVEAIREANGLRGASVHVGELLLIPPAP